MLAITLPWPPSANTIWRNVGNRTLLSRKGREYRQAVVAQVAAEKAAASLAGRLSVVVTLYPPDRRRRDIDNHLKATLDALTHAGIWEDDEQIDRLTIVRAGRRQGGAARVEIEEMEMADKTPDQAPDRRYSNDPRRR